MSANDLLKFRTLYDSPMIAVLDYICRDTGHGHSPEEQSDSNSITLMRHGARLIDFLPQRTQSYSQSSQRKKKIYMATQYDKASSFHKLHIKGEPLVLFNIWDAGSAKAIEEAGAKAIATGSWSVAAANGYGDGEEMPLDLAIENIKRIIANVTLPVTLDFEGGYTASIEELKTNIDKAIDAGAVGINFEDQIVGGDGLYSIEEQSMRISAIRETAERKTVPLFINARTDVFLKTYPAVHTSEQLEEVIARAAAYAKAGANGLFAPGLRDPDMIRILCERSPLPVNIMVLPDTPTNEEIADLGVARISYGPAPYREMIEALKEAGRAAFSI